MAERLFMAEPTSKKSFSQFLHMCSLRPPEDLAAFFSHSMADEEAIPKTNALNEREDNEGGVVAKPEGQVEGKEETTTQEKEQQQVEENAEVGVPECRPHTALSVGGHSAQQLKDTTRVLLTPFPRRRITPSGPSYGKVVTRRSDGDHKDKERKKVPTPAALTVLEGSFGRLPKEQAVEDPALAATLKSSFASPSPLNLRKLASMRFLSQEERVPIAAEDLVRIVRLAEMDAARNTNGIAVNLVTKNYNLAWVFSDKKRPKEWKTLDNMQTDYLQKGGNTYDAAELINSPRSVLTFLRHGKHPMELQQESAESMRSQLAIEGVLPELIEKRAAFYEEMRSNELKSLQHEYRMLRKRLPDRECRVFYELIDPQNLSEVPELYEEGGVYRVRVPTEDPLAAAMAAINERIQNDRTKVKKLLETEMRTQRNLEESHEREQLRNMQAADNYSKRAARMTEERQQEATIRTLTSEMKKSRRDDAVLKADEQRVISIEGRERRAEAAEQAALRAQAERQRKRKEKLERKQRKRAERVAMAAERASLLEAERQLGLKEKELHRERQQEAKLAALRQKEEQQREELSRNAERRSAIVHKSEAVRLHRQRRAEEAQEKVELRLSAFAEEKRAKVDVHRLLELRKEVLRDEAFEVAQQRLRGITERNEAKQRAQFDAFLRFKEQQRLGHLATKEDIQQLKILKRAQVTRAENVREYERLVLIDDQIAKGIKMRQVADIRHQLVVKSREERQALSNFKQEKHVKAAEDSIRKEKSSFFTLYNKMNPSPLVADKRSRDRFEAARARERALFSASPASPPPPDESTVMNDEDKSHQRSTTVE